jgi:cytochrome c oxidase assembly factor CtaG
VAIATVVTLAAALSPPVDQLAHRHLAAHMTQHVLLVVVAAPLAGWSIRRPAGRHWWFVLVVGAVATDAALVLWHVPALYDSANRALPVHAAEHLSLFLTAALFWWAATRVEAGERQVVAVLAVFATSLPATLLGAAMTFSSTTWYRLYPSLADQQLAGAVMWGAGGMLTALAAVLLLAGVLRAAGPARPATARA